MKWFNESTFLLPESSLKVILTQCWWFTLAIGMLHVQADRAEFGTYLEHLRKPVVCTSSYENKRTYRSIVKMISNLIQISSTVTYSVMHTFQMVCLVQILVSLTPWHCHFHNVQTILLFLLAFVFIFQRQKKKIHILEFLTLPNTFTRSESQHFQSSPFSLLSPWFFFFFRFIFIF